jgi:hypothetical protein
MLGGCGMDYNEDICDIDLKFDIDKLKAALDDLLRYAHFREGAVSGIPLNKIPNNNNADLRGIYWIKNLDGDEEQREEYVDESLYSEFVNEFKNSYFKHVYDTLKSEFNIGRVRLLKLKPRQSLSYHRDPEPRLHIPITTNPGALMIVDQFACNLKADGNVYYTDTTKYHTALNGGENDRIHMVITLLDPYE